jgi:hypothetical protein
VWASPKKKLSLNPELKLNTDVPFKNEKNKNPFHPDNLSDDRLIKSEITNHE